MAKQERNNRIAYTIRLKSGREFDVRESANAWWLEQHKVDSLLFALGTGSTVDEACDHAGITQRQFKYFARLHPELAEIRKSFDSYPKIRARLTLRNSLDNPKYAMSYLERKLPAEFGNPDKVDNVRALMDLEWDKRKQEIKEVFQIRDVARTFKSAISGLTDNDDPMPWDPKNHQKELRRVIEEVRIIIKDKINALRVESGYTSDPSVATLPSSQALA